MINSQKQQTNRTLETAEISRYSRQIILPAVGLKGNIFFLFLRFEVYW